MTATLVEPCVPWLRELSQVLHTQETSGAFLPQADLLIDEEGVTVYIDVPGLHADNLEIELENDTLTVRGERPFPYSREDGGGPARRIERGFGRFERSLRVPPGLDPAAIDASLSERVLKPGIPKPITQRPHPHRDQGQRERTVRRAERSEPLHRDGVQRA
jgi:HSP20 family molecular chaperone IbpA